MAYPMVVLASASPRRSELLARMGVVFVVDASEVDETCAGSAPEMVQTLARRKALAVAPRHPQDIVLAADTVVDCDGILGKPRDEADARRMLRLLAGRWHEVYTGVCVVYQDTVRCDMAKTRVLFMPLDDAMIDRYVRTGDSMDKAGAYAIQGMAGTFIERVEGCPHNVMGLPMAVTRKLLTI